MTDVYTFGEDEARRIVHETLASERERAKLGNDNEPPHSNRQLRVFHKLPTTNENDGKVHVALAADGFDFTELHNPCSDADLVEVRSASNEEFEANETAFFEGTVFEQELAIGLSLAGKIYFLGGNHLSVVGQKLEDNGTLYIVLDDCPEHRVRFEWLTPPTEDIADGTELVGLYVKAKELYVAVVAACEEDA